MLDSIKRSCGLIKSENEIFWIFYPQENSSLFAYKKRANLVREEKKYFVAVRNGR
jgi:hypothetical protein